MKSIVFLMASFALLSGCSASEQSSQSKEFIESQYSGFQAGDSPYNLAPGSTISICSRESNMRQDVIKNALDATKIWLKMGHRPLKVTQGCDGDRVITLSWDNTHWGVAYPKKGKYHPLGVGSWSVPWTGYHELGHVFGFGHSGKYSVMNGFNGNVLADWKAGKQTAFDRSEVERLLARDHPAFNKSRKAWQSYHEGGARGDIADPQSEDLIEFGAIDADEPPPTPSF